MPGPLPAEAGAPLRAAYRQALLRRLAAWPEPLRARLAARLPLPDEPVLREPPASPAAVPGPLAQLVHELQSRARPLEQEHTRRDWKRLSLERELARSRAVRPQNPGPLNSQALMLRTLQQLQALAPAYLEAFVAQAEALAWLEEAQPRQAKGINRAAPG